MEKGITNPKPENDEKSLELSLRPVNLDMFIGQEDLKRNLKIFMDAAKARYEALDHVLFHGSPGLGKTTLANIISNELQVNIKSTSGPVLDKPGDLAAILTSLEPRDVLFVDEIHRLNHIVEEILYPALEDFTLDIIIGQGPSARTVKLNIPPFTLVGATTRTGLLTPPLRDRFGIIQRLEFYKPEELQQIIEKSAAILSTQIDEKGAFEIAKRSRGTPRIAASKALDMLEVDDKGLDKMDRLIMLTIIEKFGGGPIGVETLSAAICEEKDTIEEVYEPFLIQNGYINRTPRGRVATSLAYEHFGCTPKKEKNIVQTKLF